MAVDATNADEIRDALLTFLQLLCDRAEQADHTAFSAEVLAAAEGVSRETLVLAVYGATFVWDDNVRLRAELHRLSRPAVWGSAQ